MSEPDDGRGSGEKMSGNIIHAPARMQQGNKFIVSAAKRLSTGDWQVHVWEASEHGVAIIWAPTADEALRRAGVLVSDLLD